MIINGSGVGENFKDIIGFQAIQIPYGVNLAAGNDNPQNTAFSQKSSSFVPRGVPQVQPNPVVNVLVSGVSNPYNDPQTQIYSVYPSVAVGAFFSFEPNEYIYNDMADGFYNQLRVVLANDDFIGLKIIDPEIRITLQIRKRPNSGKK